MIKVIMSNDFKNLEKILSQSDKRVDYFFNEFMVEVVERYKDQLIRRIPRDDEFREYRSSFQTFIANVDSKDIKDGETKELDKFDRYVFGVKSIGVEKRFDELRLKGTKVIVKKKRRTELSFIDLMLFRYQPWTLDTIPILPYGDSVYLTYQEIKNDEYYRIARAGRKKAKEVVKKLKEKGFKPTPKERIVNELKVVSNFLDLALKLEFGIEMRKKTHWTSAAAYIEKTAWRDILKNKKELQKVFVNANFNGFKNKTRLDTINNDELESFGDFVERIYD